MTEGYEALVAEINRTVNSPYPTQLKRLRDVLCTKCDKVDISRWTLTKPCQIGGLTRCVLDGLRQWPYVLDIVTKLSCSIEVRDAILRQESNLLYDIIQQAVNGQDVQSKYTEATITLLSHPLPDDIGLPCDVQTLFTRIFDHAARDPSMANIKPVHRVLRGTSNLLVGLLSSNVMCRFEEHLLNILRNNKGDNQSLSLYCLAIMKILSTASDDQLANFDGSYDTQELLQSLHLTAAAEWKPDTMSQFFTDSKAQKTVHLVTLCAIWACTTSTGESFDDKSETLLLANEVIAAVPINLREQWRKDNALIARKFGEKALAPVLDSRLRLQAMCLLLRLTEGGLVSATVMDSLRGIIVDVENLKTTLAVVPAANLEHLAGAGVFDQATTTALLQNAVDFAAGADAEIMLEVSVPIVNVLRQLPTWDKSSTEGVMLALDVLSCGQKLRALVKLSTSPRTRPNTETLQDVCDHALQSTRNNLVHELCIVFLKAALSSPYPTYSAPEETVMCLLDLHAKSTSPESLCSHVGQGVSKSHRALSIVEEGGTPEGSRANWRTELQVKLQAHAAAKHDGLIAIFVKACADLEARCEQVEQPLREEQNKSNALQTRYDELSETCASLEAEGVDRSIRLDAVEMEKDRYMSDLEAAREEVDSSAGRITELEQSLQTCETRARKAVEEAIRAREAAGLERATALAKEEEEKEVLQEQLQRSAQELNANLEQLDRVRKEQKDSTSSQEALQRKVEQLEQHNNGHQAVITRLQTEQVELMNIKGRLETLLKDGNDELRAEQNSHQAIVDQLRRQASEDSAAVKQVNEQAIADMQRKHNEAIQSLRQKILEVDEEMRQLQVQHSSELELRGSDIVEKQKKIDRLGRKCEQRDKQISEANAMRCNIMAAMGLAGSQAPITLPHRPSKFSALQTEDSAMETQADTSPPTPSSENGAETQQLQPGASFASNTSSGESRSGPTPKRARQGKAFRVPSLAKPRLSTRATSWNVGASVPKKSRSTRQPLLSMSANRSPRKNADPKTPRKSATRGDLDNLDESTFKGTELFAGTPGEGIMNLGDMLDGGSGKGY